MQPQEEREERFTSGTYRVRLRADRFSEVVCNTCGAAALVGTELKHKEICPIGVAEAARDEED